MNTRTRLLVVDGDFRRRAAIAHCLADSALHAEPFEDAGELIAANPREGIVLAHDDADAIAALLQHMGKSGNWLPIIAYAPEPAPSQIVEAVLAGAVDYLTWPLTREAIEAGAATARLRADAQAGTRLREAVARSRIERLTKREREVLSGVADGLSNRMIGEKLAISPRTVEIHRANMLNKMGASHTSEAIRIAIEASLVD